MRRFGIPFIALALAALTAGQGRDLAAESSIGGARLIAISSTLHEGRAAVLLEASEPVAYAPSQPEPDTLVLELRNVTAAGYANGFAVRAQSPFQAVSVEETRAGGLLTSRVRVRLAPRTPLPRVRSQRNLIIIEADAVDPAAAAAPAAVPARRRAPGVLRLQPPEASAGTVNFILTADGPLEPPRVLTSGAPSHRLVLDFAGVAPESSATMPVGIAPVERVRIALNNRSPLVTRVVVDLAAPVTHTIEPWGGAGDAFRLTIGTGSGRAGSGTRHPVSPVAVLDPILALATSGHTPAVESSAAGRDPEDSGDAPRGPPAAAAALVPEPAFAEPAASGASQAPVVPQDPGPPPARQPPAAQPVAPPPTGPIQDTNITRTGERVYTGHPVSLDFQGADLRAVLRTFAEISGLNIVIDPAVQGSVDVALRDVPWDQALDIILRANKLGYFVDGTIVRVAPLTVLAEEEKQRRRLAEEQALSGELRVITKTLSYAKAEDIAPLVTKSALTPRGSVQVDPRTNTLIISDLQSALDTATALLNTLDQPQPQVEIEARIVQTTREFARSIGVQWGINGRMAPELGNTSPFAFPNSGSLSGRTGGFQGPVNNPTPTAVNLGVSAASSAIGLALGAINGSFNLDTVLSALERSGKGRLLSTPRVSTQNNVEAEITQGVQIPIQTVANNTVTVTFKDAALTLKVTPQITSAGTVIMKISVENAAPDFSRAVGESQIPPIDTQRAITQVLVNDGQTTVIGGIYVSREQSVEDRTPGLNRIPLLGWLFKRQGIQDESRELLIFITPRILRS